MRRLHGFDSKVETVYSSVDIPDTCGSVLLGFLELPDIARNLTDVLFDAIQVLLNVLEYLKDGRGGRFCGGVRTRTEIDGIDRVKLWSAGGACYFLFRVRRGVDIDILAGLGDLVVQRGLYVLLEVHVHFTAIDVIHQADYILFVVDRGTGRRGPSANKVGFYDDVVNGVLQIDGDGGHDSDGGRRDAHVCVVSEDLCGPVRDDDL